MLKKIAKYVADPDFAVEMVGKVSKAAKSLCMWVHAMDVYSRVAKDVAPKRKKLAEMKAMLAAANTKLAGKEAELKALRQHRRLVDAFLRPWGITDTGFGKKSPESKH